MSRHYAYTGLDAVVTDLVAAAKPNLGRHDDVQPPCRACEHLQRCAVSGEECFDFRKYSQKDDGARLRYSGRDPFPPHILDAWLQAKRDDALRNTQFQSQNARRMQTRSAATRRAKQ